MSGRFRLGIDVGGTFTDFILADPSGPVRLYKTSSTHDERAIREGLELIGADLGLSCAEVVGRCETIIHGTTVALNALIEHKGARVGLLTTAGHEDSLEIRLGHKEDGYRYDFSYPPATILVPRYLRVPVRERVTSQGQVYTPLHEDDIEAGIAQFKREGVEAVAISFLWSFLRPEHERRAAELVRRHMPEVFVSCSLDVYPQIREYTRTSTTVVNAYVGPILSRYISRLDTFLRSLGYQQDVLYVQNNGGLIAGSDLATKGAYAVNSGPAAGPAAGRFFGELVGTRNVITVDMGGTSFDISLVRDGRPEVQKDVDFIRYRLGIPMLHVETLGAGGGSIAQLDAQGMLQVGPESAGAFPGPVAYGRGGERPTVTDSLVTLGYLNNELLLGGRLRVDAEGARRAIASQVAEPLGIPLERAALGIYEVVNANMTAGIRRVSIEKGHDPRDFALVVGGGAGPAHACALAGELGIRTVIVPRVAGALCAFGAVLADMKYTYLGSFVSDLDLVDPAKLDQAWTQLELEGRRLLSQQGVAPEDIYVLRSCDMRYQDQIHECSVAIPFEPITAETLPKMAAAFHQRHEELYSYREPESRIELINIESAVCARVPVLELVKVGRGTTDPSAAQAGSRRAFFPAAGGWVDTPVYVGSLLKGGNRISGPALIEEATTSLVIEPGWSVLVDERGFYVVSARDQEAS